MRTQEITLYTIDELSEDAKEHAINDNRDWNVCDSFWYENFDFADIAAEYGLTYKSIETFDLDPNYKHIAFNGLRIVDAKKILSHTRLTRKLSFLCHLIDDCTRIELSNRGWRSRKNTVSIETYRLGYHCELAAQVLTTELQEIIDDFCDRVIGIIEDEYEYLTSEAAIYESIWINELEFTEDGKRY